MSEKTRGQISSEAIINEEKIISQLVLMYDFCA